jgi:Glycosyltransferase family 87
VVSRWRLAACGGALVFCVTALLPVPAGLDVGPLGRYGEAVVDGNVPYRDFSVEYPPGSLPAIVLPALVPGVSYERAFRSLEVVLGVLLVLTTAFLLRDARLGELVVGVGLVALLPALLGAVVFFRFDLWPALLVSLSLLSLERRRSEVAAGLLGLAVATKLYGLALVPSFLSFVDREGDRRRVWRASAVLVAAVFLVTVPLAVLAPGGVASSLQRQFDRPLQIESVGASPLLLAGDPNVEFGSGSWNLTGAAPTAIGVVSTVLGLGALVGVSVLVWKRRRSFADAALAYAACVAIILVFGKVASPQFLVWLAPLVAVVRGRSGLIACLLSGGACVLTQLVYPVRYEELIAGDLLPEALLAVRNVLLIAVALVLTLALVRRSDLRAATRAPVTVSQLPGD